MNGHVSKFRKDLGVGVIVAEDGRRYRFTQAQVVNARQQIAGESVDFLLVGQRPAEIIVMAGSPWTLFGGPDYDDCA